MFQLLKMLFVPASSWYHVTASFVIVAWLCANVQTDDDIHGASLTSSTTYQEGLELCEAEVFEPDCPADHVVVITMAKYGRMKISRCVQVDYGYVGCEADVMEHLDSMCSGRRKCELRIPDQSLDKAKTCPKEFKTYLNVSYRCLEVEKDACRMCNHGDGDFARVTQPSNYLGSVVSAETRSDGQCGSAKCPWKIEVKSGQTINITLYDFAMERRNGDSSAADQCYRYAMIKEKTHVRDTPVCGGKGRQQVIYSSVSNTVEIHIVSSEVFSRLGQFVIKYEAIGCPDLDPPEEATLKRFGDRSEIRCHDGVQKWEVKCVGNTWVGETDAHCTAPWQDHTTPSSIGPLSVGLLAAIVIGIALVIAVLIVTVGVVCLKRQHREPLRPETTLYVRPGQCYELREQLAPQYMGEMGTLGPRKPSATPKVLPGQVVRMAAPAGRRNFYDVPRTVMETRPLPSIPSVPESAAAAAAQGFVSGTPTKQQPIQAEIVGFSDAVAMQKTPSGSASRPEVVRPHQGPIMSSFRPSQIPSVACVTSAKNSRAGGGPVIQHYTDLDPSGVRELEQLPSGPIPWTSGGPDPIAPTTNSYASSGSDDGGSNSSSVGVIGGEQQHPLNGSSNEIPLRPMREGSQPKIDSTAVTSAGVATQNSGWFASPADQAPSNTGNSSWP